MLDSVSEPSGAFDTQADLISLRWITIDRIDDAKGAKRFKSSIHAARSLVHDRGFSALYRGTVSTTIKQSATSAVRMGTYNFLKETTRKHKMPFGSTATTFAIGAAAGVVTVYATQPFDVIKTRSQSAAGATIKESIRSVWADYGAAGFWKGSSMRLGRLLLSGGIVFTVYEQVAGVLTGHA